MTYIVNFDQISTSEAFREEIYLVAADDLTPIDAVTDGVTVTLQMFARSSRGAGDQSQSLVFFPIGAAGGLSKAQPVIGAATNDGTGLLTLVAGILAINIPTPVMQNIRPGYYQVGIIMNNQDTTEQIAVGTLPLLDGGVLPSVIV